MTTVSARRSILATLNTPMASISWYTPIVCHPIQMKGKRQLKCKYHDPKTTIKQTACCLANELAKDNSDGRHTPE